MPARVVQEEETTGSNSVWCGFESSLEHERSRDLGAMDPISSEEVSEKKKGTSGPSRAIPGAR